MRYDRILSRRRRAESVGFTLVELLVVITIIGVLVGMMLPAVQVARETARKAQCANNLRQWGLGALQHEEGQGYYPGGGWSSQWVGDPDRGFGMNQPGGWLYNCLPFVEQNALHNLGAGDRNPSGTAIAHSGATTDPTARPYWALKMVQTPVAIANCPTRRRSTLFTCTQDPLARNYGGISAGNPNVVARTDYAGCVGHAGPNDFDPWCGPPSGGDPARVNSPSDVLVSDGNQPPTDWSGTGVIFFCSQVPAAQIRNGTSNVILIGEKYENPDFYNYAAGVQDDAAENENMYVGMDDDNNRLTASVPMADREGYDDATRFGSAHAQGCNFIFCDGSVRSLSYSIDPTTFMNLGRRAPDDGTYVPIDASKL